MVIPNTVTVGGQKYQICCVKEIIDSNNVVGRIMPDRGMIEIKNSPSEDYMNITFLHELIHGLHEHMGLGGTEELDEAYVDSLANALYMVIKDNPGIFSK